MVKLEGKKCLIVGGGKVAQEKINGLLPHGAEITVVSPRVESQIQTQARAGNLEWIRRRFSPKDVTGALLVIAATNSSRTNSQVFQSCLKRGILCNSVDDPENCNFFYPAIVRRGALQISISTHGQSPALASRLRRELEEQFGPEWEEWLNEVGTKRGAILRNRLSGDLKRQKLMKIASPAAFREFVRRRQKTSSGRQRSRLN